MYIGEPEAAWRRIQSRIESKSLAMSRRRRPRNRLCRNSKLTEMELLHVAWKWLSGHTAKEAVLSLQVQNGIEVSERTVRSYFNRIGAYLYEHMRDIEMRTLVPDFDAFRASISDDEYEKIAGRVFENAYDEAVTRIGRQDFLILKELRSPSLTDAMHALNELSAKKRGIGKRKKEAIAWACFHDRIRAPHLARSLPLETVLEVVYATFWTMLLKKPL
jgi:hypothetical protein